MEYGEFVKSVRKKLSLSQKQLAIAINVSYTTINRWENGHVSPSKLAVISFYDFCDNNFIDVPDINLESPSESMKNRGTING